MIDSIREVATAIKAELQDLDRALSKAKALPDLEGAEGLVELVRLHAKIRKTALALKAAVATKGNAGPTLFDGQKEADGQTPGRRVDEAAGHAGGKPA